MDFVAWNKIPRLHRDWEITEKIDGTNGILYWSRTADTKFDSGRTLARVDYDEDGPLYLFAGSRTRWLSPREDNFGFAAWATANAEDLIVLGPGRHFGEWYGRGIQRGYGLMEKRFALFDSKRVPLDPDIPKDIDVVPVLTTVDGNYLNVGVRACLDELRLGGSVIVPGFAKPEGVVVRHKQHGGRFKALLENDDIPKDWAPEGDSCAA